MRMRHSTLAIAVNIGMVSMVSANAIPDSDNIEHVVVTATGYEQKLTQAPASISVITAEVLSSAFADVYTCVDGCCHEDSPIIMNIYKRLKADLKHGGPTNGHSALEY